VSWRRWTAGCAVAFACCASCSASTDRRCIACSALGGFPNARPPQRLGTVGDGGLRQATTATQTAFPASYFDGLGIPRLGNPLTSTF